MHANMGGFPGMNVPIGFNDEHLPIGLQILGNTCCEAKMYQLASFIEDKLNLNADEVKIYSGFIANINCNLWNKTIL